jgi:hypothetical protein
VEEFLSLQEKIPQQVAIQERALSEAIAGKMVISEDNVELKPLYIDPTEKFMDNYVGTGKENLAKHIHFNSVRAEKPYIAINCSAFSDTLLESRLFGYKKGAYTGAALSQFLHAYSLYQVPSVASRHICILIHLQKVYPVVNECTIQGHLHLVQLLRT